MAPTHTRSLMLAFLAPCLILGSSVQEDLKDGCETDGSCANIQLLQTDLRISKPISADQSPATFLDKASSGGSSDLCKSWCCRSSKEWGEKCTKNKCMGCAECFGTDTACGTTTTTTSGIATTTTTLAETDACTDECLTSNWYDVCGGDNVKCTSCPQCQTVKLRESGQSQLKCSSTCDTDTNVTQCRLAECALCDTCYAGAFVRTENIKSYGEDVDQDGRAELVAAMEMQDGTQLFALSLKEDGSVKSRAPIIGIDAFEGYFGVIGDLDGNGFPEIMTRRKDQESIDVTHESERVWQCWTGPVLEIHFMTTNSNGELLVQSTTRLDATSSHFIFDNLLLQRACGWSNEPSDGSFSPEFGISMVGIGHIDGDAVPDIAIGDTDGGCTFSDDFCTSAGKAKNSYKGKFYTLMMNPNGTVKAWNLIADGHGGFSDDVAGQARLGTDIVNIGYFNSSYPTLAVGAKTAVDQAVFQGAVYLMTLNSQGTVSKHQKVGAVEIGQDVPPDDLGIYCYFGSSIVSAGKVNGTTVLVVGAERREQKDANDRRGRLYVVYLDEDGNPSDKSTILLDPNSVAQGEYGSGLVAISTIGSNSAPSVLVLSDGKDEITLPKVEIPLSDLPSSLIQSSARNHGVHSATKSGTVDSAFCDSCSTPIEWPLRESHWNHADHEFNATDYPCDEAKCGYHFKEGFTCLVQDNMAGEGRMFAKSNDTGHKWWFGITLEEVQLTTYAQQFTTEDPPGNNRKTCADACYQKSVELNTAGCCQMLMSYEPKYSCVFYPHGHVAYGTDNSWLFWANYIDPAGCTTGHEC